MSIVLPMKCYSKILQFKGVAFGQLSKKPTMCVFCGEPSNTGAGVCLLGQFGFLLNPPTNTSQGYSAVGCNSLHFRSVKYS